MTDVSSQETTAVDTEGRWQSYLEREAARNALFEALRPINQNTIFDALASAGIFSLVVEFDGYGDSGQIESITATGTAGETDLPETSIDYATPSHGDDGEGVRKTAMPLADAIEELCYDLLRHTHAGWENNDGAFGDFTFDVAARTIGLDHSERYTAIESYSHAW